MIHPVFEGMSNPDTAEALSELYEHPFIYATAPDKNYLESSSFPPIAGYTGNVIIGGVVARYLYLDEDGWNLGRITLQLGSIHVSPEERIAAYDKTLGDFYRTHVPAMLELAQLSPELGDARKISAWYLKQLEPDRRRLLSAHITARATDTNELTDAIAVPRPIFDKFPFKVREGIVSLLARAADAGLSEEKIDILRGIARNQEESASLLGVAAAAMILSPAIS